MIPLLKKYKKQVAFTLAEILITLLIIGVVASLVIPNLMHDTQNAELKVAWKKAYGTIEQTVRLAQKDDPTIFSGYNCYDGSGRNIYNALKNTMGYIKECNSNVLGNCWADNGVTPDTAVAPGCPWFKSYRQNDSSAFIAKDGTFWLVYSEDSINVCPIIAVDVNGKKGPNQWNKDVLSVGVYNNKITLGGEYGVCVNNPNAKNYLTN